MREINSDIEREEENEIKDFLYKHFIKQIKRVATRGAPEWYKEKMLQQSFERSADERE